MLCTEIVAHKNWSSDSHNFLSAKHIVRGREMLPIVGAFKYSARANTPAGRWNMCWAVEYNMSHMYRYMFQVGVVGRELMDLPVVFFYHVHDYEKGNSNFHCICEFK